MYRPIIKSSLELQSGFFIAVTEKNEYIFLSSNKNQISQLFDNILYGKDFIIFHNNKWIIQSKSGLLIKTITRNIEPADDLGWVAVKVGNFYGYFSPRTGHYIPAMFENVSSFNRLSKSACVKVDQHWRVINQIGQLSADVYDTAFEAELSLSN